MVSLRKRNDYFPTSDVDVIIVQLLLFDFGPFLSSIQFTSRQTNLFERRYMDSLTIHGQGQIHPPLSFRRCNSHEMSNSSAYPSRWAVGLFQPSCNPTNYLELASHQQDGVPTR